MQEITFEDIEFKNMNKAKRMLRSETARSRRRETKQVRETRLLNAWAKARRKKKND